MKEISQVIKTRDYIVSQMSNYHLCYTRLFAIMQDYKVIETGYKWVSPENERTYNELGLALKLYNDMIADYRHEQYLKDKEEYEKAHFIRQNRAY